MKVKELIDLLQKLEPEGDIISNVWRAGEFEITSKFEISPMYEANYFVKYDVYVGHIKTRTFTETRPFKGYSIEFVTEDCDKVYQDDLKGNLKLVNHSEVFKR